MQFIYHVALINVKCTSKMQSPVVIGQSIPTKPGRLWVGFLLWTPIFFF